ncbi:MAG: hypothetical protein Q9226_008623 [Calogaya cf. arnoldii]
MRTVSVPALLALGLAVQQTAATAWTDAQTYSNPSNTNNQCIGEQSKGLGFDDHSNADLGNYGALNWENLKCTDGLKKRTFGPHEEDSHGKAPKGFAGGRCASGVASKSVDTSPKFSCGPKQKGMSIDHIHVSASEKTEIELHYGYGNGVICKQTATCGPAGNIIKNHQCGNAKTVTVKLPDTETKEKCEVGIHSVGFNCGPASSKPPVPSSTPVESQPVESTPVVSTSHESKPYPYPTGNTTTLIGSTAPSTIPESTSILSVPSTSTAELSVPSTTLESPTTPINSNSSVSSTTPVETIPTVTSVSSTGPIETIPTVTSVSSTSPLETGPTTTAPGTTVPVVTTEVIVATVTTCPVTNTITSGSSTLVETTSTVSTIFVTSTSTVCTYCVPPPASTIEITTVPIESPVVPPETSTVQEIPETTPISSATENSPDTSSSSVPITSSSIPAAVPTTQAIVTTEVLITTVTTCPVTNTITSGDSTLVQTITTVSTITSTSTSTICTQCAPPAETFVPPPRNTNLISPPAVITPSSSNTGNSPVGQTSPPVIQPSPPAQAPPAQYPAVLPNCMKTWITITTCKDTTDSSCYCLDPGFTKTVQECVSAWAVNKFDIQGALSNLAGICADHVSKNPGIITNVPKTITLVPTPASQPPSGPSNTPVIPPASSAPIITPVPSNPGSPPIADTSVSVQSTVANSPAGATNPPPAANPVTTLSLSQSVPYPCPVSQLADGQPQAPASSCTSLLVTQVIVPQVGFETVPAAPGVTSNPSVDLVAGSPAPNPAVTTAGPVAGSGPASTFGTVVGSVNAVGSTFPQGPVVPFTGGANSIKATGFGMLVGVVGLLFLI